MGDSKALIRIDLQKGFKDDVVIVKVNQKEFFRKEGLSTMAVLGVADSFEVDVPKGTYSIEVSLPLRNIHGEIRLDASKTAFLGVSIEGERVNYNISQKEFTYR